MSYYYRYLWNKFVRRIAIDKGPAFIVGCGHSGTSLLRAILGSHSRIYAVPGESRVALESDVREFRKTVSGFDKQTVANGKKRWFEKTPKPIQHIDKILNWISDAKIIIILRNGRDVAYSIKQRIGSLAKGPESALQKLAQDELSRKKSTPEQRLQIADRWWELSQDKKLSGYQAISLKHYRQVVGDLKGLPKVTVENRIEPIESTLSESKTITFRLTNYAWKIEWQSGWVWEGVHLSQDHLILSSRLASSTAADSKNHKFEFKKTSAGIIVWPASKNASYELIMSNGQLICSKLDRNGKQVSTGIGYRTKLTNDK